LGAQRELQYAREVPFESLYWVSDPGSGAAIWDKPFQWPFRLGYRPTLDDWITLGIRPVSQWPRQGISEDARDAAYAVAQLIYSEQKAPGGSA